MVDERLGVAIIGDALEVDITQPACALPCCVDEPRPVVVIVDINVAVRLHEVAGGNEYIMQSAPMDTPPLADGTVELFGEPLAVAMT